MAHPSSRLILITGASTGLGLALTNAFLANGDRVIATARPKSMNRFKRHFPDPPETLHVDYLDITDHDQRLRIVKEIQERWGHLDILINNAGLCFRAVIEHLNRQDLQHQFEVNVLGPLHLTREFLPMMRARRKGMIINVSSVGGMMAMPTMGAYSASKFALEGSSEALWYELRPWGIKVVLVEPGFIHSESFRYARFTQNSRQGLDNEGDPYHRYYHAMLPFIEKMMGWSPTTPERIARQVVRASKKKDPSLRMPATYDAWFFRLLRNLLPARWHNRMLYHRLPDIKHWVDHELP